MRVVRGGKRKAGFLIKLAVFALCVYGVAALVNQQSQIAQKKSELEDLDQQISTQIRKNEEIRHIVESGKEENKDYIERVARESLGFARPGERVFINTSGN